MAASGRDRPRHAPPSDARLRYILVGQEVGIQHACLELGWVLAYKADERETLKTNQGIVQDTIRSSRADVLLITLPVVRRENKNLKTFLNRVALFCKEAGFAQLPVAIFHHHAASDWWTQEAANGLARAYTLSTTCHRWCALGLSNTDLGKGHASNQATYVHTSMRLNSTTCRCRSGIKHIKDWDRKYEHDEVKQYARQQNNNKMFNHILLAIHAAMPTFSSTALACPPAPELHLQKGTQLHLQVSTTEERENHGKPSVGNASRREAAGNGTNRSPGLPGSPAQTCLPTAARERQKAKEKAEKEAGITKKKATSKKNVEAHYDDCGDSLAGLNLLVFADADNLIYQFEVDSDGSDYDDNDDDNDDVLDEFHDPLRDDAVPLYTWAFLGDATIHASIPDHVHVATNMQQAYTWARTNNTHDHVDIVELCGGAGRPLEIAIHRRMRAGRNFDLTTGIDLSVPDEVAAYWAYLRHCRPRVVVMAPPCTPFGPWAHFNSVMNPQAHQKSLRECRPLARLAGETALFQLSHEQPKHDFLNEQPDPSALYQEEP